MFLYYDYKIYNLNNYDEIKITKTDARSDKNAESSGIYCIDVYCITLVSRGIGHDVVKLTDETVAQELIETIFNDIKDGIKSFDLCRWLQEFNRYECVL